MDSGNAAWLLMASAMVLFMTPGLAFFYGGMVRSKNVLNMLMKNFFTIALITPLWVIGGYTLAFGDSTGGLVGDFSAVMFRGLEGDDLLFAMFQMTFAIITPALISGAVAERLKFSAYAWFIGIWSLLVYSPIAHWVWHPDGWIYKYGALDFAGGLVVHINAGIAALALVMVLGPRLGFGKDAMRPHSLPLTCLAPESSGSGGSGSMRDQHWRPTSKQSPRWWRPRLAHRWERLAGSSPNGRRPDTRPPWEPPLVPSPDSWPLPRPQVLCHLAERWGSDLSQEWFASGELA